MKKITYYNTDLEKYVETEVPININIVTESERFDTQKMLAIGYEKRKIKNKQEQEEEEENKIISNIYDSYLDSVIYTSHSTLPFIEDFGKGICDVLDNCLENDVYNIYNTFDEVYSDI